MRKPYRDPLKITDAEHKAMRKRFNEILVMRGEVIRPAVRLGRRKK